jgi:23S rRNA (cytidine1920-2'-O)/16S rRNA (cytidine1409-2'-O)-methyltransferase
MTEEKLPEIKKRLDIELHARGLVRSRSLASDLIKRGKVTVNGAVVTKPSVDVGASDKIEIAQGITFVSRAGEKLAHALAEFKTDVTGLTFVDIGSSTGGFTDCLLKNGATKVIAVDIGTDQFDKVLREDPHIELHENTDIRKFTLESPVDAAVIDISFISLEHVLPKAFELVKKGGFVIALAKPQFEVGKEIADKHRGVITDPKEQKVALDSVKNFAKKAKFKLIAETTSPIEGEKGNKEFLILLKK